MKETTKRHEKCYSPVLDSIVVSIPACHAGDQGSIPCRGANFFEKYFLDFIIYIKNDADSDFNDHYYDLWHI